MTDSRQLHQFLFLEKTEIGEISPKSLRDFGGSTKHQRFFKTMNIVKILCITLMLMTSFHSKLSASDLKSADLAGSWYPASKMELEKMLKGYISDAPDEKIEGNILALISPHAGYQFSGSVAAYGFKSVISSPIKTVIVLGFSHKGYFDGVSVYNQGSFSTPLGVVKVDEKLADSIMARDKKISFRPEPFRSENSVEMQVPFIQVALPAAKIVPVILGSQSFDDAEVLSGALAAVLKGRDDCLIVASTDMSHFHGYDEANEIDEKGISVISGMKAREVYDSANAGECELCGVMPVTAILLTAEKLGYDSIKVLKYANSGDTYGDKSRVVGYLSAVIYKKKEASMLNHLRRKRLLQVARESISLYVIENKRRKFEEKDDILNEPLGAFVTLSEFGELRGCIGNMVGRGPLYQTVADMAIEAATGDPRFSSLKPAELNKIDIEISVLSPLKRVKDYMEIKIPGHGVLVKKGFSSGVYLPQVAEEAGWNKEEFLTSLCGQKAGIDPYAWKDPATELFVFNAEVFGEKGEKE